MSSRDDDMYMLDLDGLQTEILQLRRAIRLHRDLKGHERCWLNDAALYVVLPEGPPPPTQLPPRDEFLENCAHYWRERQNPEMLRLRSPFFRRIAFAIAKRAGIV